MRIAINEGLGRVRKRKSLECLEREDARSEQRVLPRQIADWKGNSEQLYSRKRVRERVAEEVRKLPAKYRVVVMLRHIEQLSSEEAATVLGMGMAALRTRLLRGRLMRRAALTPYFIPSAARRAAETGATGNFRRLSKAAQSHAGGQSQPFPGGRPDEFMVLTMDAPPESAAGILLRVRASFRLYNSQTSRRYDLSMSLGAACFDSNSTLSLEELMGRAIEARRARIRDRCEARAQGRGPDPTADCR